MYILVEQEQHILRIRFNREEKKNALTHAMYAELAAALVEANKDSSIRVILFTGSTTCFTSGNDMTDFLKTPPTAEKSPVANFMQAILQSEKPLVAAVNGAAVGIGTTMLLHFDLVYAGISAQFQMPFVSLGLCPEFASSWLLPQLAGQRKAAELLLLGEKFSAQQALDIGLINTITADAETEAFAVTKAQQLAAQPAASVRLTKQLMRRPHESIIQEIMLEELKHFKQRLLSAEATEAMQAFLQKRKPDFSQFS